MIHVLLHLSRAKVQSYDDTDMSSNNLGFHRDWKSQNHVVQRNKTASTYSSIWFLFEWVFHTPTKELESTFSLANSKRSGCRLGCSDRSQKGDKENNIARATICVPGIVLTQSENWQLVSSEHKHVKHQKRAIPPEASGTLPNQTKLSLCLLLCTFSLKH